MRVLSNACPTAAARALAISALVALGLVAIAGQLRAADISVAIDEARLVRLSAPSAEIIVGNPSIADVSVQSAKLLVVTGKSFGVTNMIVLDSSGHEILNRKLEVGSTDSQVVTLTKGAGRQSYVCSPVCRATLIPGDEVTFFDNLGKQVTNKFGVAAGALAGGAPSQ